MGRPIAKWTIFIHILHVWVFLWWNMVDWAVLSTRYDVSLVLRLSDRTKVTKGEGRRESYSILISCTFVTILESLGMRCVLVCALCAYSNSCMVFSRADRVQLLLPETLVSPQWPTNCSHEWLHEDNTRLWHLRYCWKTYCNVIGFWLYILDDSFGVRLFNTIISLRKIIMQVNNWVCVNRG